MAQDIKSYFRSNRAMVKIIWFLLGAAFVGFGSGGLLTEIGVALVATFITVTMTELFLGDSENEELTEWGLVRVFNTRGEMNSVCDGYLQKAKRLDAIAFGMKSLRDTQQKQLERILAAGGDIRIITMKPGCEALKMRERDELLPDRGISDTIEQLIDWAKRMNARGFKGKVQIRYHDHLPQDFMFLMDNRLFTGPYEYGKGSQQIISYEYRHGKAYSHYEEVFSELWNDPNFCTDALIDS